MVKSSGHVLSVESTLSGQSDFETGGWGAMLLGAELLTGSGECAPLL